MKTLTREQVFRYIPKKHLHKFNTNYFDIDCGNNKPLYFILLKDEYEVDGMSGISFYTINELKGYLNSIYKVGA